MDDGEGGSGRRWLGDMCIHMVGSSRPRDIDDIDREGKCQSYKVSTLKASFDFHFYFLFSHLNCFYIKRHQYKCTFLQLQFFMARGDEMYKEIYMYRYIIKKKKNNYIHVHFAGYIHVKQIHKVF